MIFPLFTTALFAADLAMAFLYPSTVATGATTFVGAMAVCSWLVWGSGRES